MKKTCKRTLFGFVIILIALFIAYITNADGKMIEKTYDFLINYHDERDNIVEKL
ncbi:MAG: hypothetical protein GX046_03755 [Tissierellia bacterium]|jgi:hypothetical protein|nr:hypothetical protein [Tissierellia bacterium]